MFSEKMTWEVQQKVQQMYAQYQEQKEGNWWGPTLEAYANNHHLREHQVQ